MAEYRSAEQVRARHLAALGPALGPVFYALFDEVASLHIRWQQYRELFAHSAERVQLLNETGAQFFRVVQDLLWADVLLSLARLTDRPRSGKTATLTVRALPGLISDPQLSAAVEKLVAGADTPFIRDLRNRRLAHRNRDLAIGNAEPLPEISRRHIEEVLAAIRAVMNRIERHYLREETIYEETIEGLGDARAVVANLRLAREARAAHFEHLKAGRNPRESPGGRG